MIKLKIEYIDGKQEIIDVYFHLIVGSALLIWTIDERERANIIIPLYRIKRIEEVW